MNNPFKQRELFEEQVKVWNGEFYFLNILNIFTAFENGFSQTGGLGRDNERFFPYI